MKKIKKSIAVVAALLLMTSGLNANNVNENDYECFEWADSQATILGFINGWTHAEEHQVFLILFDECVNQ